MIIREIRGGARYLQILIDALRRAILLQNTGPYTFENLLIRKYFGVLWRCILSQTTLVHLLRSSASRAFLCLDYFAKDPGRYSLFRRTVRLLGRRIAHQDNAAVPQLRNPPNSAHDSRAFQRLTIRQTFRGDAPRRCVQGRRAHAIEYGVLSGRINTVPRPCL